MYLQEQSRSSNCNCWNLLNGGKSFSFFLFARLVPFKAKNFLLISKLLFRSCINKGLKMFISIYKETPDVGHMLDTKGKDKLAVALANAKSELGARPVVEHKVVVFQTPEDELE